MIVGMATSSIGGNVANKVDAKFNLSGNFTKPKTNIDIASDLDISDINVNKSKVMSSESFSNWDDMKAAHYREVTKFLEDNKPKGSPIPKNWFEKGGSLTIDTLEDGTQIWKYTNASGNTVPYVPKNINGQTVNVIEFPENYLHPNKNIANIDIGEFTGNRSLDKSLALEKLSARGIDEIPEGYILHHSSENGVLQLLKEDIHTDFNHYGGNYYYK